MEHDLNKIAESLHPLERKVLPFITNNSFSELSKLSGIPENEISRPLQWLQEKELIKINEKTTEIVEFGKNGKIYAKSGLPEKKLLALTDTEHSFEKLKSSSASEEFNVALGILKSKQLIEIRKNEGKTEIFKLSNYRFQGEEEFLKKLPFELNSIPANYKPIFEEFKKRKDIIRIETKKFYSVEITALGAEIKKINLGNIVDNITPELLSSKEWKNYSFRRYNINVPSAKIFAGRRHFVREAIEYVRKIWLDMGFKEMSGNIANVSFWNFDALFTAQDHPVRELQDTFFIKEPKYGKLPEKHFVDAVRDMHEKGGNIGSKGWQYKWNETDAKKNVLRTHTTVLSAKTIAKLKESDLPAKFFSVGECFRNETLDWSHLFEFHQAEGIVIDENANMRNLIGYLKEFFRKMGYEKIRTRPAYFPYTEPSMEIDVYHPVHKKWVELGGSGIFRPEVVVPLLGKDVPVLAWGIGLGRMIPEYYGISDIRDLYKNDLKQLRELKAWLK